MQVGSSAGNYLGTQFSSLHWSFGLTIRTGFQSSFTTSEPRSDNIQFRVMVLRFKNVGLNGSDTDDYFPVMYRTTDSGYVSPHLSFKAHWEDSFDILYDQMIEVPLTLTTNGATPSIFMNKGFRSFRFEVPVPSRVTVDTSASVVNDVTLTSSPDTYATVTNVHEGDIQCFVIPTNASGLRVTYQDGPLLDMGYLVSSQLYYTA